MATHHIITTLLIGLIALHSSNVLATVPGIQYQQIDRQYTYRHVRLHAFTLEQGQFDVSVMSFHQLEGSISPQQLRRQSNALIVMSGGFYYPDYQHPVGLVIQDHRLIQPLSRHLSGVIWMKDGHLHLAEQSNFDLTKTAPEAALQGYPRLVDPINKMGIYKPSRKFAHRAAICTRKDTFVLIINDKGYSGMSLYELAELLQKPIAQNGFACDIAVNLDGGPAPGISVSRSIQALEIHPFWQLPNVIMIRPKN